MSDSDKTPGSEKLTEKMGMIDFMTIIAVQDAMLDHETEELTAGANRREALFPQHELSTEDDADSSFLTSWP